jgi:hypothetical protein
MTYFSQFKFFNPFKLRSTLMHIETQVKAILDLVTANTASLAALTQGFAVLTTAVANIPAQTGTAPDLTALNAALSDLSEKTAAILTGVTAIQSDVEVDETAPSPAPAPTAA